MDKYIICQSFHHSFLAKWLANYVCMGYTIRQWLYQISVTLPCWMEKLQHHADVKLNSAASPQVLQWCWMIQWLWLCGSFSTVIQDCLGFWNLPRCRSNGIVHANMTHFWWCPFKALAAVGPHSQGPRASSLASMTGFWAHHWWGDWEHQSMSSFHWLLRAVWSGLCRKDFFAVLCSLWTTFYQVAMPLSELVHTCLCQ